MDERRFDDAARWFGRSPTRRGLVARLGVVFGAATAVGPGQSAAAACRKPGKPCKRDRQCCSGRCTGKKDKKRCRPAPVQGVCTIADNACFADDIPEVVCGTSELGQCICFVTVSGEAFCADTLGSGDIACDNDANCVGALAPGARCIQSAAACGDQRVCKLPCPIIIVPIP
jgi:hypothetical protein